MLLDLITIYVEIFATDIFHKLAPKTRKKFSRDNFANRRTHTILHIVNLQLVRT